VLHANTVENADFPIVHADVDANQYAAFGLAEQLVDSRVKVKPLSRKLQLRMSHGQSGVFFRHKNILQNFST
jgi:hypothetical protein